MEGLIMNFLCAHVDEEIYQRDLEDQFYIRPSTASRCLKRLEYAGLVRREGVPHDARLKLLVPTERALGLHEEMRCKAHRLEGQLAEGLSEAEQRQFLAVAAKMQRNLMRLHPPRRAGQENGRFDT